MYNIHMIIVYSPRACSWARRPRACSIRFVQMNMSIESSEGVGELGDCDDALCTCRDLGTTEHHVLGLRTNEHIPGLRTNALGIYIHTYMHT